MTEASEAAFRDEKLSVRGGSAERDGCGGEADGAGDREGDSDGGGERERFQSRAEMSIRRALRVAGGHDRVGCE